MCAGVDDGHTVGCEWDYVHGVFGGAIQQCVDCGVRRMCCGARNWRTRSCWVYDVRTVWSGTVQQRVDSGVRTVRGGSVPWQRGPDGLHDMCGRLVYEHAGLDRRHKLHVMCGRAVQ